MAKQTKTSQRPAASKRLEELQVSLTVKNAEMISSAVKMAVHINSMSNIGPEGIMTTMIIVVSDFIDAMASALGVPRERFTKDLLDSIQEYVSYDSNFKHETGN